MADESNARLHWWQEEQKESDHEVAAKATSRLAIPAPENILNVRDIGEELEAEARARAAAIVLQKKQSVAIYYDVPTKRLELNVGVFGASIAILFFAVMHVYVAIYGLASTIVNVEGAICLPVMTAVFIDSFGKSYRRLKQIEEPALLLTPEGVRIHTLIEDRPTVLWQDITDIKAINTGFDKYLRFTVNKDCDRKKKRRHIWIRETQLPTPLKELVKRIAAYRAGIIES